MARRYSQTCSESQHIPIGLYIFTGYATRGRLDYKCLFSECGSLSVVEYIFE